ncbi:Plug domain-containing protein [Acidaminococcus massiliensis]|uniref:Plug domain-containing protein n=1 Tax=Acidaminococcus massiliensis TaxID=1852375 RepID=UPI00248EBEB9|nr:Plug domain-containing protein [Acidaminococcus massiliensis]
MRKSVSKKLTGAILWTLCFQALPGVAGAMPTYQLDDSTVTVDRYEEPKAEPVDIPAEPEAPDEIAGGNTARTADYGTLGKRDVMTTPFNMTTFTEKMIQDRQAASVNDVIANDASTTDQTLSGASQAWNIRGFKSTSRMFPSMASTGWLPGSIPGWKAWTGWKC